jgi:hypothetical protein
MNNINNPCLKEKSLHPVNHLRNYKIEYAGFLK